MKLYVYDHCPYCVRARMIFGLKNIAFEKIVLLNDDEVTPNSLVGKKVVPILIKEDGTAMPESLDIVRYVDQHFGAPIIADNVRPELEQLIKQISSYSNRLLIPRFIKLGLPEYATEGAITYFINKKTESIGDFAENLANTAQYVEKLQLDLTALESLILAADKANGEQLSIEDIILFPILRNLTCVKEVNFPTKVKAYVEKMAELSQIELYTNKAL